MPAPQQQGRVLQKGTLHAHHTRSDPSVPGLGAPSYRLGNQGPKKSSLAWNNWEARPTCNLDGTVDSASLYESPSLSLDPGQYLLGMLTCLPPSVHQSAPAIPHHVVQPLPGLMVDGLTHWKHTERQSLVLLSGQATAQDFSKCHVRKPGGAVNPSHLPKTQAAVTRSKGKEGARMWAGVSCTLCAAGEAVGTFPLILEECTHSAQLLDYF